MDDAGFQLAADDRLILTATRATLSVIIPTFRRPEGLKAAMDSVAAQTGLDGISLDLIICDNSPEASARDAVAAFAAAAAFRVLYVHEPATGVANARNSAVAACGADFIAFLDDDEAAPETWLAQMVATQCQFDADVVFGPVTARLAAANPAYCAYFERFFSRAGPAQSQRLDSYYGCGNSLIRRACLPTDAPFEVSQNTMGGEDDHLFQSLQAQGAVMAWAAGAFVYEDVPPTRSRLSYTLRRAFAYGQGPSHIAAIAGKPLTCAGWMLRGLAQFLLLAPPGGVLHLLRHRQSTAWLDKAARGLGKLLWFPPFKIGFYGAALLKADPPVVSVSSTPAMTATPDEDTLTEADVEIGELLTWRAEQRSGFSHSNLLFEHMISHSRLFSDEALIRLIDRYPRHKLEVFTMGYDPAANKEWYLGRRGTLDGRALMEGVRAGRLWLNLRKVNHSDRAIEALCQRMFAEVQKETGVTTLKHDLGLLISSPNAHVFYHLDIPLVMLWQIRGVKTLYLYPPQAPCVIDRDLEAVALRESDEQLPYNAEWDSLALRHELQPGEMMTWAQNAPHRIVNHDMVNVSLSIEFMTPKAIWRANLIYANGLLRRFFGFNPSLRASPKWLEPAKIAYARLIKSLGGFKGHKSPLKARFALDAAEPGVLHFDDGVDPPKKPRHDTAA